MEQYDVEVDKKGTVRFYKPGTNELHRLDGPAVEHANGDKSWFQNGERHRIDGPAIENSDGTKSWYQNDKLHRLDGPAVEWANGDKGWWIEGVYYTEEEFKEKIASMNVQELTIAEIEAKLGHKVKIVK